MSSGYVSRPGEQANLIEDCYSVSKSKPLAIKLNTSKWLGSYSPEHSSKAITYQSCGTGFIRELHGEVFWVQGISAVQNLNTRGIYRRHNQETHTPVSEPIKHSEPGLHPHLRHSNSVLPVTYSQSFPVDPTEVRLPRKDRCSPLGSIGQVMDPNAPREMDANCFLSVGVLCTQIEAVLFSTNWN